MSNKTKLYFVRHDFTYRGIQNMDKFIGIYSSEEKAREAIASIENMPGFSRRKKGFKILKYTLNKVYKGIAYES
mgnify:CR=1 FL=1